jgi:DNA-binding IclR family transcriptional regulator
MRSTGHPAPGRVTGVVPRTLALLRELGRRPARRRTASELARRTGIPLQTVHRVLTELGHGGLVMQDAVSRTWSLGPLAITLGATAAVQAAWPDWTSGALARIADESTETAILTVRHGAYATHVEIAESSQPLRLLEHPGMVGPLSIGASRRVILAHLPDADQAAVLAAVRADGIPVDETQVLHACAAARRRGYEVSHGEVTAHTVGVSVAIRPPLGDPPLGGPPLGDGPKAAASLTVAGPDHRMDRAAIVAARQHQHREAERLAGAWQAGPKLAGNGDLPD